MSVDVIYTLARYVRTLLFSTLQRGTGKVDGAEFMQTLKSDFHSNQHFFVNLDLGAGSGENYTSEGKSSSSSDSLLIQIDWASLTNMKCFNTCSSTKEP